MKIDREDVIAYSFYVLIFIAVFAFAGCGLIASPRHPVMTATEQGAAVEIIQPERTMDRDNVPAGVDPDKIIAHVSDPATGEEVWIENRGLFKKPAVYHKKTVSPKQSAALEASAEGSSAPPLQSAATAAPRKTEGLSIDIAERAWWYWPAWVLGTVLAIAAAVLLAWLKGWSGKTLGWISTVVGFFRRNKA